MSKNKSNKSKSEPVAAAPNVTRVSARLPKNFSSELVLGALCAELFGSFVLTAGLLNSAGNIIIASITMIVLVMALSRVGGGHINPLTTISLWATRQITGVKAAGYVIAQVLGAMLALVIVTQFVNATPINDLTGQAASVFVTSDLVGQWRPFFAELLGGMIFGVSVAAAVLGRKKSMESGFIIGGGLLVALIIASLGSSAIVNPAAAIGLSAFKLDNFWTFMAYAVGPILGAVAGAWLYKLLQWDVTGKKTLSSEEE